MNLKKVKIKDSGWRGNIRKLEGILRPLPVSFGNIPVEVYIGLGKIVYIRPINYGVIYRVNVQGVDIELDSKGLSLKYRHQKYEIRKE